MGSDCRAGFNVNAVTHLPSGFKNEAAVIKAQNLADVPSTPSKADGGFQSERC